MLDKLKTDLKQFVEEREWEQFHTAKNLAIDLSIEASEVLEHFVWHNDDKHLDDSNKMEAFKEEIGDVLNSLLLLAMKFDIDVIDCAFDKLEKTKKKYPIHLCRGNAKKHTELTPK
ncbi:MAG: nucleotide pyrophosphohydrolase [Simkaniaceae bacterium]|nr:nucleotide pyrophosphohydrolase [Simkaniaceae bacterium]MCF7851741.1 nucleotide pyrophosphohydrolase [Simkaniaceae bacterium]